MRRAEDVRLNRERNFAAKISHLALLIFAIPPGMPCDLRLVPEYFPAQSALRIKSNIPKITG